MEEEIKAAEPQPSVPPSKRTKRRYRRRKKAKVEKKSAGTQFVMAEPLKPQTEAVLTTAWTATVPEPEPDVPEKEPEPEPQKAGTLLARAPGPLPTRPTRPVAVLRPRKTLRQPCFLDNGAKVMITYTEGDGTRFEFKHNQIVISTPSAGELSATAAPRASAGSSRPRQENPSEPSGSDSEFLPPMTPTGVNLEADDQKKLAEFLATQEKTSGGF